MSVHTYITDELCPNCGSNILESLVNHVYAEGGRDFETECPNCKTMLEIEVQPVPAFTIAKVAVKQNMHLTDGGLPVSDGLSTPATIGG